VDLGTNGGRLVDCGLRAILVIPEISAVHLLLELEQPCLQLWVVKGTSAVLRSGILIRRSE
jgi:hypothetical protein